MKSNSTSRKLVFALLIMVLFFVHTNVLVFGQPTGVDVVFQDTEIISPTPATELTTAGGSFTTLVLNGTFQNPRWKAYVGNISGTMTLSDAESRSIFRWDLATASGQIYVSRSDNVLWETISCAGEDTISSEETFFDMAEDSVDSISNTFNQEVHREFYVGTELISESSCSSIATFVDDEKQEPSVDASFQEILLQDSNNNLVFTTILEQSSVGYDSGEYDFQLIVPENPFNATPTTYFFYAEIH